MPDTQNNDDITKVDKIEDTIEKNIDEIQNVDVPVIKEYVSLSEKIFNSVKNLGKTIWGMRITSEAMKYITWYAAILIFACTLYLIAWCWNWHTTGKADLSLLLQFIHEIVSSPYIAVIGFIAKWFSDKNNDGIPDGEEDLDKSNNTTPVATMANAIQNKESQNSMPQKK